MSHFDSCGCGFLGALASSVGKYAFADDLSSYVPWGPELLGDYHTLVTLALRGALVGLMLFLNGVMLTYFLRALERNSSISVTVLSTVCNIISSGVLGWLLFGEAITSQWVMGSVLMSVGILLVAAGQPSESKRA